MATATTGDQSNAPPCLIAVPGPPEDAHIAEEIALDVERSVGVGRKLVPSALILRSASILRDDV